MNMAEDLAALALGRGWTDRPAYYEADRVITHGQLHDLAARAATVLADAGVTPARRVLIALPDGIAWVTAFLATARLGATAVLVNPALTAADHAFLAADSETYLAVTEAPLADRFTGIRHLDGAALPRLAAARPPAPAAEVAPDHPLYIQYTSGTTSRAKGVVHRHADPAAYHAGAGAQVLRIGPDDVTLSVSKLFYAYGFGNALAFPLHSGGSAVLVPGPPRPPVVAALVARHRVSHLYAVPSALANLLAETDPADFRSVRAVITAGEPLGAQLADRVGEFLGAPLYDQLGSTEAGHAICTNGPACHVPGTVGRPAPGFRIELRDRAGRPVPDGTEGEMWVHGPTVTPGYLGRPAETARLIVDGWLNTRDRAVRNPDGTYRHLGRTDDLEMVGGITVSPLEIEQVLAGHPGVRDVAVASIGNERGATKLRAFVVPRRPVSDPEAFATELTGLARRRLAPYKVPRGVELVPSLPRTATGKLQRFLVRQGSW
ncbi:MULTISPECIES: AMP-binding protein [Streptomycetaceae]|uniref:Acyl-CoA synthase n=1 Tax=Streptantibioticus cattleyicolor (strain ATCC 35852 / DSM 46488 / JCM 4925 / NBRC 14057 / NRRL 8057) TaxID=1003195 RepID=F8JQL3_STREN|nr:MULTISPECIES: AMP-binding protein [Streptomycetaceae]AEW97860.1 acyl-CoA synthase [Streptantibioticus cattleyicolor NRRL 8057 = DSM 46488]MYS62274.1 AMP-binding protein [Streptomyces sp. SID5468]CCB78179.1 Acyl-CoA synthase [Streptantibioticus cattleyicolor NRRL 8057 = DSM 46488]